MTTKKDPTPIDFTKVDALRKHMLLTTSNMAKLLGVSRMTYYAYLRGQSPQRAKAEKIRAALKKLLHIMAEHNWPTPEAIEMEQKDRFKRLSELVDSLE